jgi:hypothetical protein
MTLAEFVDPWIDGLANQGRRPSTLAGYRHDLASYVLPRLGAMALQDIRVTDVSTRSTPTCSATAAAAVGACRWRR